MYFETRRTELMTSSNTDIARFNVQAVLSTNTELAVEVPL